MEDTKQMTTNNNPFGRDEAPAVTTSAAQTEGERAVAEVKAAVTMAMANPRQPVKAMDRILQECQRPTLAEQAVYAYPRGGQQVTGPSIRLAEALARNWGNVQYGIRELGRRNNESEVEAYAWDLETNTRSSKVFTVPHSRDTKRGKVALTDSRDIYEMIANQGARRLRNAILSIIPGDVIEAAVKQCDDTVQNAMGAPAEQIQKMLAAFGEIGVDKAMIERRLGHRLDADSTISSELINLRKIYTSIKDGYSAVADWFERDDAASSESSTASAKEKLKAKVAEASAD